jgi:hypothetical protein
MYLSVFLTLFTNDRPENQLATLQGKEYSYVFWGQAEIFWEFKCYLFLLLLWFFLVIVMAIVNYHGVCGCHLSCRWDDSERRGCLTVTLAAILDPASFS